MKQTCLLFILLFYILPLCRAQSVENESVTTEIDSLLDIAQKSDTDFDIATEAVLSAKAKAFANFGDQNPQYASCLYQYGRILYRQGKYEEAKEICLGAIKIQEAVLGKDHPDYVQSVKGLGDIYLNMGDFANAEARLLEAQTISEKAGLTGDELYAGLLSSLGNYYRVTGNLGRAGEYYQECIQIGEKIFGKTHQKYASALHNAALVHLQKGDYEAAEKQFIEARATFAQTQGTNSENYGVCIQNLSGLYRKIGDFGKAEKLALESLEITAITLGETHADYAINLENLANLYMEMGNYDKAKAYYFECINLREATLGKEHYYFALSLNNLGNYYMAVRDFAEAEKHFANALAIYQKSLGNEHYYTMLAKGNLAWSYREQGKYNAAEPLILEVISMREKYQGAAHPDLARSLVNLAFLQKHLGKYEKAEKLYRRAAQIWLKSSGPESLDYLASLQEIASLQIITGQTEAAFGSIAEAGRLQKLAYFKASMHLSENELAAFTNRFSHYLHRHFSFLEKIHPVSGEAIAQAFDDAIFYKGYLLEQASRVKKFTIQDPVFAGQYERMGLLRTQLAAEYAKPSAERSHISEMEEEINAIEKTMVASVAGYREHFQQISWRDIQQALQPGEALVEFVHYDSLAGDLETGKIRYAALVISDKEDFPAFVPLCAEKEIIKLMGTQTENRMKAVQRLYSFDEKIPEKSLHHLLWQPLEEVLESINTVYFSPSGLLHRLNIGAIQQENGHVLAERYQLIELSNTRQLALPLPVPNVTGVAALFGGIEYDLEKNAATKNTLAFSADFDSRNSITFDSTELRLRGEVWDYLEWTKTEVETISLLAEGAGVHTSIYSGSDGSEEAFKRLGRTQLSPRILHLATHGYFFSNKKTTAEGGAGFQTSDHPMIRSGLILAGGNYAWENGQPIHPGTDDGILTAYEIAQLDLSYTELVVLSACETGLGDIRGHEGVYGLQRAFKFAGAKYILMSLWQVPDFQTQELMTAFYYNWLEEGMEIPAAFQAAQAELRKKYPDPILWAGFILVW